MMNKNDNDKRSGFHLDWYLFKYPLASPLFSCLALKDKSLEAFQINTSKCAVNLQGLSLVFYGYFYYKKSNISYIK